MKTFSPCTQCLWKVNSAPYFLFLLPLRNVLMTLETHGPRLQGPFPTLSSPKPQLGSYQNIVVSFIVPIQVIWHFPLLNTICQSSPHTSSLSVSFSWMLMNFYNYFNSVAVRSMTWSPRIDVITSFLSDMIGAWNFPWKHITDHIFKCTLPDSALHFPTFLNYVQKSNFVKNILWIL